MNFFYAGSHSRLRILHTRLLALFIFLLVLASGNRVENGIVIGLLDFVGLACVLISAFGRVWSSVYISGYKTGTLVELGPYSVTRNPLYLFSLIGAIGIGFASGSFFILALLSLLFGFYYPFVIHCEEENLKALHGQAFLSYMERVPRFLPNLSLYSEPETYVVKTKQLKRALWDASYFIWIYGGLELIHKLRQAGILPTFFKIP